MDAPVNEDLNALPDVIEDNTNEIEQATNTPFGKTLPARSRFTYNITADSMIGIHPMRTIDCGHRCIQFLGRTVDQAVNQEYTARAGDVRRYRMTDLKYDIRTSWIVLTQPFTEATNHDQRSLKAADKMTCVCCQEDFSEAGGLACGCGIFICGRSSNGCLGNHVVSSISHENMGRFIDHEAKIRCMPPCDKVFDDWKIAHYVRSVHFTQYQTAQINILEGKISRNVEAEYEERLQTALNASKTRDEQVKDELREFITQNILTLRCPEEGCRQAFVDFDACCALECSRCKVSFCAWCLQSFKKNRNACHRHIGKCAFNITAFKSLFAEESQINEAWNARRTKMLTDYFKTLPSDHVKIAVTECEPYLKELCIKVPGVSSEMQITSTRELYIHQLEELSKMGFLPEPALLAITKTKGNLQQAVADLLEFPLATN